MRYCILSLILLIIACQEVINEGDEHDLLGRYTATYFGLTDTLELKGDRTYLHGYINSQGTKVWEKGSWKFEMVDGNPKGVTFNDFVFRTENGQLSPRGLWNTGIRDGGKILLCYERDLGSAGCFKKSK